MWGDHEVTYDFAGQLPLGNLRSDGVETVLRSYHECESRQPDQQILAQIRRAGKSQRLVELAREFGDPEGRKMYRTGGAAVSIWLARQRQGTQT